MTIKEYKKLLESHNWYYSQSDVSKTFEKGLQNERKLKALFKENPKFETLYKEKFNSIFKS